MSASRVQAVDRLIKKLERWKEKRLARGLDCSDLRDAIFYLHDYRECLADGWKERARAS